MTLRILGISLSSFMLGAALFAGVTTRVSTAHLQDDRTADRSAIRVHLGWQESLTLLASLVEAEIPDQG